MPRLPLGGAGVEHGTRGDSASASISTSLLTNSNFDGQCLFDVTSYARSLDDESGGPPYPTSAPAPAGRRRQRGGARSRQHASAVEAEVSGIVDDGQGDVSAADRDLEGWIMPWMRPPSWLYPQPLVHHLTAEATLDTEAKRRRLITAGHDEQKIEGAAADEAAATAPAGAGQLRNHDSEAATTHGAAAAALTTIARAGIDMAMMDPSAGEQSTSAAAARSEGHDGIRGRDATPGARGSDDALPATIRGPDGRPGAQLDGGVVLSTAQKQLDRRNWHLRTSLELHAERVRDKRGRAQGESGGPTAAERMDAIRRRIAQRERGRSRSEGAATRGATSSHDAAEMANCPASSRAAPATGSCTQPETGAAGRVDRQVSSIEDGKIHLNQVHAGRMRTTACIGRSSAGVYNAVVESGLHGDENDHDSGPQAVTPPAAAAAAAARYVAWHSSSDSNAPAAGR